MDGAPPDGIDARTDGTIAVDPLLATGLVRRFTLKHSGILLEAWRAPVLDPPARRPTRYLTPWGPQILMRPGTWALWSPDSRHVVAVVGTLTALRLLGDLSPLK